MDVIAIGTQNCIQNLSVYDGFSWYASCITEKKCDKICYKS